MSQTISINVPDQLLERLYHLAKATDRPVEELVVSTLAESMPRPPTALPTEIRDELLALESFSDKELMEVAQETLSPEAVPPSYTPGDVADRLALRRAYALVLLKWRGRPLPDLEGPLD
jgi:predicted transcriptional regulator